MVVGLAGNFVRNIGPKNGAQSDNNLINEGFIFFFE
jgi:hypothetical protein